MDQPPVDDRPIALTALISRASFWVQVHNKISENEDTWEFEYCAVYVFSHREFSAANLPQYHKRCRVILRGTEEGEIEGRIEVWTNYHWEEIATTPWYSNPCRVLAEEFQTRKARDKHYAEADAYLRYQAGLIMGGTF